jgi:hypothetical protein
VWLAGNRIGDSRGNGIQLRNLAPTPEAPLLIDDNLLASSQGSAVDASEVAALALVGNRIGNTPEYAVSLRNATPLPGPLLLSGNRLGQVGKAVVRVEGLREVELANNTFDGKALLQNLLANSDVLLGLDDPELYNSKSAKNVLLSSYGRQMALIGPNVGFVRAGALASTYSDQDDWLAVLDRLLDQPPAHLPRSLYPALYAVSGNQQVARALGLEPIDPNATAKALAEGEPTP